MKTKDARTIRSAIIHARDVAARRRVPPKGLAMPTNAMAYQPRGDLYAVAYRRSFKPNFNRGGYPGPPPVARSVITIPGAPANPLAPSTTLVYKDSGAPVNTQTKEN